MQTYPKPNIPHDNIHIIDPLIIDDLIQDANRLISQLFNNCIFNICKSDSFIYALLRSS